MKDNNLKVQGSLVISNRNSVLSENRIRYQFASDIRFSEIYLDQLVFNQTIFNVSTAYGNSTIQFKINAGATQSYTFSDGFYSATQLCTVLVAHLNTYHNNTFSFSITDYKILISWTGNHTLQFIRGSTWFSNAIYDMMGLASSNLVFSTAKTVSFGSDYIVNFTPIQMIQMRSPQLSSQYQLNYEDYVFYCPITVDFGYTQQNTRSVEGQNVFVLAEGQTQSIQYLDLYLFDQNDRPISIPANWSYALKFDLLY